MGLFNRINKKINVDLPNKKLWANFSITNNKGDLEF